MSNNLTPIHSAYRGSVLTLEQMTPGTFFRPVHRDGTGQLIDLNVCEARVQFTDDKGRPRREGWSLKTPVRVIDPPQRGEEKEQLMNLSTTTARKIFAALGFKASDKWTEKVLEKKIARLVDLTDGGKLADDIQDEELRDILKDIITDIQDGKSIILVEDEDDDVPFEPQESPAPKKGKGKGKETPTPAKRGKKEAQKETPAPKKGKGKAASNGEEPQKSKRTITKVGVIATILECLQKASAKKPISKDGILEVLTDRFPDRDADSMLATINVQVPSRISKEKGISVEKNDKGYWAE